jgi:hypothetical protein
MRRGFSFWLDLAKSLMIGGSHKAKSEPKMPLPIGSWTANFSGFLTTIEITTVNAASGNVTGTVGGAQGAVFVGYWDEITHKLNFCLPNQIQLFTGFLFEDQFRMPGIIGGTVFTLAGQFTGMGDINSVDVDRPIFGWYAQIGLR